MKASDLNLSTTRVMLWGPPGSGKTVFAGTLGEILQLIDLDGNAQSLATFKDKFYDARRQVDVLSGFQYDQINEAGALKAHALDHLKGYLLGVSKAIREKRYPFKALCIDSLTTMMEMGKMKVLRTHRDGNQKHDLTLSQGQYQFMFNEVGDVIRIFNSLPILTILICHERMSEVDTAISHEISIPGKDFPNVLRGMFPEILYCRIMPPAQGQTGSRFTLQTVKTYDATARSCLNIPTGTDMNLGLPEILKRQGVVL